MVMKGFHRIQNYGCMTTKALIGVERQGLLGKVHLHVGGSPHCLTLFNQKPLMTMKEEKRNLCKRINLA